MPIFGKSKEQISAELVQKHREKTQRISENANADMKAAELAKKSVISRAHTAAERETTEQYKSINQVRSQHDDVNPQRKNDAAAAGMFKKQFVGNHPHNIDHNANSAVRTAKEEEALKLDSNPRFEGEAMKM